MASQVLSGSSNPSYTNTTGQNVRLVINILQVTGTVSWGSAGSISIAPGSQQAVSTTNPYAQTNGWYTRSGGAETNAFSNIRQLVIRYSGVTVYDGDGTGVIVTNSYAIVNGVRYTPGSYRGSQYGWSGDYCNSFDVSSSASTVIKEIALAPNETFSAVSGPYNILVIKEDGT